MSASNNLLRDRWVCRALYVPLIIAITFAISMAFYGGVTIRELSKENIDFAVDFFKTPLLIATLTFPLCAIAIANHRSEQNIISMRLQKCKTTLQTTGFISTVLMK